MKLQAMKALVRLGSFLLVCVPVFLTCSIARAGDIANFEPIGFSEDGTVFAYQESGIQDGSGFPYANIFVLDLEADRFIEPSPVRVLLKDETSGIGEAMAEARAEAAGLLAAHLPEPRRGVVVVERLATDLSADDKIVRFVPRAIIPRIDDAVELRIRTFGMNGPEFCQGLTEVKGYELKKIGLVAGTTTQILHRDTGIPVSRGCPFDYGIRQVRVFMRPMGGTSAVAIIAVRRRGFEGPDIRHIAVPVPMDPAELNEGLNGSPD